MRGEEERGRERGRCLRRQGKERGREGERGPSNSMAEPVSRGGFPLEKMAARTVPQDKDCLTFLLKHARTTPNSNE